MICVKFSRYCKILNIEKRKKNQPVGFPLVLKMAFFNNIRVMKLAWPDNQKGQTGAYVTLINSSLACSMRYAGSLLCFIMRWSFSL